MIILAAFAIFLPQLILLLLLGSYLDLLGGLNHTQGGLLAMLWLITLAPFVAVAWLVALVVSNIRGRSRGRRRQPLWPAVIVLLQAVIVHWLVLARAHM